MIYLKILANLFRTWFLPTPAHDDPRTAHKTATNEEKAAALSIPTSPEEDHQENYPPGDMDEEDTMMQDETDEELPDPSIKDEIPNPTGAAPLNPVAPPEAAEQRASRCSSAQNPFAPE